MTTSDLGLILLTGAAVVLAAIVAARITQRIGLPGLLVFLGLGLALGEAGAGVRFDNAGLAEVLGLSALVLILAEGGLTTRWVHARAATPAALSLATVVVAVSGGRIGAGVAGPPAAVAAATLPLRVPRRQQAFLSWAGLRGAVPIVLATIPMNARLPGATRLFDIVFIVVAVNALLQGPTLP